MCDQSIGCFNSSTFMWCYLYWAVLSCSNAKQSCNVVLTFTSLIKPKYVTIQMDAIEQYLHVLLFSCCKKFSNLVFRFLVDACEVLIPWFILFLGGTTLYIETSLKDLFSKDDDDKGHPSLDVTGQLGDVMKESSHIAYTFAKVCVRLRR